ncbi:hypothetical protein SDC9_78814 [bioreactor metagenome]|uniref:Uncharacterized protein n=1 Tax=bioreactor metagenome TaxID=1076179 RepID=A0A644YUL0_9ZZZZ
MLPFRIGIALVGDGLLVLRLERLQLLVGLQKRHPGLLMKRLQSVGIQRNGAIELEVAKQFMEVVQCVLARPQFLAKTDDGQLQKVDVAPTRVQIDAVQGLGRFARTEKLLGQFIRDALLVSLGRQQLLGAFLPKPYTLLRHPGWKRRSQFLKVVPFFRLRLFFGMKPTKRK